MTAHTLIGGHEMRTSGHGERAEPFDNRTPLTEGQIRAATIGELKPLSGPIRIVNYDPRWPELFGARPIASGPLGKDALRMEHVGSTSVPGLVAKPIIDMLLVVADSADETAYVPALETAGYVLRIREPHWYEHRMFKGPDAEIHLHVFTRGCPEIDRMLMFRDRLRHDAADRDRYARTKLHLARSLEIWPKLCRCQDGRRRGDPRGPALARWHRMSNSEDAMQIIEKHVSAEDRAIFDLDEFLLTARCTPTWPTRLGAGAAESPVWFHWDGRALWFIGGTSFPANLLVEPRCAIGIVDWDPASGLSQHVGLRGRVEVLPFDNAVARTIFRKYFGPDEERWDPRFREDIEGESGVPLIRFTPETVVLRDESYKPPWGVTPT